MFFFTFREADGLGEAAAEELYEGEIDALFDGYTEGIAEALDDEDGIGEELEEMLGVDVAE